MIKQMFGKSTILLAAIVLSAPSQNLTQTTRDIVGPISKLAVSVDQLKAQQEKVDENLELLLEASKLNFGELLSTAIKQGNVDQILRLIKAGASVEHENNKKNRPIHIAAENSKHRIIELLIENHADVNVHGEYGYTPLHWTSYNGCLNCARILLENGAVVDSRDDWSDTPLIKSSKYGYTELVQLLLSKGADVNAAQGEGYTGLHMASREGRVAVVKLLLKHGANPRLRNKGGDTPLDIAARKDYEEIVALLKNKLKDEPEKKAEESR